MRWGAGGREWGARMEAVAPAVGRAQSDFPSPLSHLKITRESLCGPATFFLLFCSCFVHVLHGTGFVSSTPLYYLPCPNSCCERFDSPETPGIPEKMWYLFLGHGWVLGSQGWACSLWLLRRTSPSRQMPVVSEYILAFGVTEERESLHGVNAVVGNQYQQPRLFISHTP